MRKKIRINVRFMIIIRSMCFSFLLVSLSMAQSVHKVEKGLYSTGVINSSLKTAGKKRLIVKAAVNLEGQLSISTEETDKIEIHYTKQAKTNDRSQAIDFIDLIALSLVDKPSGIILELRAPNPAPWNKQNESGIIEAEIIVPKKYNIEIAATYFDISANGPFEEVSIPNSLGRIDISNVNAMLDVSTANRRLTLENIRGRITAVTTNSSLIGNDIKAINKEARFRNNGGDIKINNFSGGINVSNSFGRISLLNFRPGGKHNLIRGRSSPISIAIESMTEGQLVIDNQHEGIDITIPNDISAYISLEVDEDGRIEASSFPFTTELIQYNHLNLITGNGKVDISSTIRGEGDIFIRGVEVD